jgi:predicted transcriptional regulator
MTEQQQIVADTAISRHCAQHIGVIQEEVHHLTGISVTDVSNALSELRELGLINARTISPTGESDESMPWAWYEWPD